jgi:hypothetical protein
MREGCLLCASNRHPAPQLGTRSREPHPEIRFRKNDPPNGQINVFRRYIGGENYERYDSLTAYAY